MNILKGKVIIMNCPPNAGKDTITTSLCQVTGASHNEFKDHLFRCTATLFNVGLDWFKEVATNRATKETGYAALTVSYKQYLKLKEAMGEPEKYRDFYDGSSIVLTPREALIYTSEVVMKPNFGIDYFGQAAAKNVNRDKGSVFSDGGFNDELKPLIEEFGAENIFVVQFTREGADTFEGDSRNWVDIPQGVSCLRTTNDGTVAELRDEILAWIRRLDVVDKLAQRETFHTV